MIHFPLKHTCCCKEREREKKKYSTFHRNSLIYYKWTALILWFSLPQQIRPWALLTLDLKLQLYVVCLLRDWTQYRAEVRKFKKMNPYYVFLRFCPLIKKVILSGRHFITWWALEKRPLNHEMRHDTEHLKDYLTIVRCISHSELH